MVAYTTLAILFSLLAADHVHGAGKQSCGAQPPDPNAASTALNEEGCPISAVASCSMYQQNSCCTEANGLFSLTQQWNWNKVVGGEKDWGIHGLWPDCCDLTFPEFCDPARQNPDLENILSTHAPDLLADMSEYWQSYKKAQLLHRITDGAARRTRSVFNRVKTIFGRPVTEDPPQADSADLDFWMHEWNKHGTCVTTLNPSCVGMSSFDGDDVVQYFGSAVSLYKRTPTYQWLADANILPGASYDLEVIVKTLADQWGAVPMLACDNQNRINELYYFFHSVGSIRFGNYKPVDAKRQQCNAKKPVWYCRKNDKKCGQKSRRSDGSDEF